MHLSISFLIRGLALALVVAALAAPTPALAVPGFPCTLFGSIPGPDGIFGTADDPQVDSLCGTSSAAVVTRDGSGRLVGLDGAGVSFRQWPSPQSVTGDLRIRAATPNSDLRVAPGTIEINTAAGHLTAVARIGFAPQPRDPLTGIPLTPGPGSPAPSQRLFDAFCDATRGYSALDRTVCALRVFNSQGQPLPGITIAGALSTALGGSFGANILFPALVGTTSYVVPLNAAPGDNTTLGVPGGLGAGPAGSLSAALSDQQEALLGCGAFYGTNCHAQGIDLRNTEASFLFQAFPPSGGTSGAWNLLDPNIAQPGTVGFTGPTPCTRLVNGSPVQLPGCRGPADAGYDVSEDGSVTGLLMNATLAPGGSPFPVQQFRSEGAALSWNFENLLVAFSSPDGNGVIEMDEFDSTRKRRTDGCSFALSEPCGFVQSIRRLAVSPLADDPNGGPPLQWLWELGADYDVTVATGDLCRYLGGTVLASGPFDASGAVGLAVLALPPAALDVDCDGILPDGDGSGVAGDAPCTGGTTVGCDDNCPFRANSTQSDHGGIGTGSVPDGIGDACQCGDVSGDGRGTLADAVLIQRSLLQPPTATLSEPTRCDVNGDGKCTLIDAVIIRRALLQPPTATIEQVCAPAPP